MRETDEGPSGTVITVFGGYGGGIGRTTISTNLAVALSQRAGRSVALADLDEVEIDQRAGQGFYQAADLRLTEERVFSL